MPYKVVKVEGGYKVKNKDTGKTYSKSPMPKARAMAQLRALYAKTDESVEKRLDHAFGLIAEKKLSYKARQNLPDSAFVYKNDRKYPIHDIAHARNALSRSSGKPEEDRVRAAVNRKYPELKDE